jgi:hypothetical protein
MTAHISTTILLLFAALSCRSESSDRFEAHHESDRPRRSLTHFTGRSELFVEFPALVVGEASPFTAHLTRLDDFKPLADVRVVVRLTR